jgi:cytochrome c-type biogenesis protein CcmE
MTRKQTRTTIILASLGVLGAALGLILYTIRDTIVFFYTPSEVVEKNVQPGTRIRLGGMVEQGTWKKGADAVNEFVVTDTLKAIKVTYKGVVPDLFREGQGVVTEGILQGPDIFVADTVLAKHDENYMPKEVADSLKAKGVKLGESAK